MKNSSDLEIEIVQFIKQVADMNPNLTNDAGKIRNGGQRLLDKIRKHFYNNIHAEHCQCDRCGFYRVFFGNPPPITTETETVNVAELQNTIECLKDIIRSGRPGFYKELQELLKL